MPQHRDRTLVPHLNSALENVSTFTLDEVQKLQAEVDAVLWTAPADPDGKRHHIFLHLVVLAGKLARSEERAEHGLGRVAVDEIVGDLLVYAAQLAELEKKSLSSAYRARVMDNLNRLPHNRPTP